VTKNQVRIIVLVVLLLSVAVPHALAGKILVTFATSTIMAVFYLVTLRTHPRMAHSRCNGRGRHSHPVFGWLFKMCTCNGGRVVRWGARRWGTPAIRQEAAKDAETARQRARAGYR
jgi:hypothetical protein